MELEKKLQLLRKNNGFSQEQLADKLGIARQTVSKWENGRAIPELNGLILLSRLYGITFRQTAGNKRIAFSRYTYSSVYVTYFPIYY